jgi:Zn-dependent protease
MFGSSLTLFRLGPTDVRVHPTFFLLLAWIAAVGWLTGGPTAAVNGVVFTALLFVCVLLHEFGHVFAARRYGIGTRDVTLLPIGGVAALDRIPERPGQEIVVALAGPAVNVLIAGALLALHVGLGGTLPSPPEAGQQMAALERPQVGLVLQLVAANVALAVFNMIPAFPLDGGRVLRALIATRTSYVQATRIAAGIGQGVALVLGFLGLFGNPLLILVAVFVFLAASGEAGFVEARASLRGRRVADGMVSTYATLGPQATAGAAADLLLQTTQVEIPVVDGAGRLRGVVTREGVLGALRAHGEGAPVLDFALPDVPTVGADVPLDAVFERMQREGTRFVGVVDTTGGLIGYVTLENIAELVMIGSARRAARGGRSSGPWSA